MSTKTKTTTSLTTITIIAALATTIIAITGFANSAIGQEKFIAGMTGREEVPPVDTIATGSANFEPETEEILKYTVNVSDIDGVTQAHIHSGRIGENGPVVVTLFKTDSPADEEITGLLSEGNITAANLEGPLTGKQLSDLIALMSNGGAYVNVHSNEFPNGEIRGQITLPTPGSEVNATGMTAASGNQSSSSP